MNSSSIADLTALGGGMTHAQVRDWAKSQGFRQSPRATHILISRDGTRRYLLNQLRVRLEARTESGSWVRLGSAPYRDLSITANGKMAGLRRDW